MNRFPNKFDALIDKYDSADATKSGVQGSRLRNQKLSPQELGLSAELFSRFDGDADGQLDFDELRQFLMSPEPTITMTLNVDTAEPVKSESTQAEMREKLRSTPDGAANINLGTTQLNIASGAPYVRSTAEAFLKPQFMLADSGRQRLSGKGRSGSHFSVWCDLRESGHG